jgi:hypothetical protein
MTNQEASELSAELKRLLDAHEIKEKAEIRALMQLHGFSRRSAAKAHRVGLRPARAELGKRRTRVLGMTMETR